MSTSQRKIETVDIEGFRETANCEEIIGNSTAEPLIDILVDDCLEMIFGYLTLIQRLTIEEVCTRWRDLSRKSWPLVKRLGVNCSKNCFSLHNNHIDNYIHNVKNLSVIEEILSRCGPHLEFLYIYDILDCEILYAIHDYCPNLIELFLNFQMYYDDHFENAFSNMGKLRRITIEKPGDISLDFLEALQDLPEEMEEIHLHNLDVQRRIFRSRKQPSFEKFNSLRSLGITKYLVFDDIMEAISGKNTLHYLSLARCTFFHERVFTFIPFLSNLRKLVVQGIEAVNDNFLCRMSEECDELKYLDLSMCSNFTDVGVIWLTRLNNLEELAIEYTESVTDDSIGRFNQLKKLTCVDCKRVSDSGITKLLENSKNLEFLRIKGSAISSVSLKKAVETTKLRKNGLKLELRIEKRIIDGINEEQTQSELLNVFADFVSGFQSSILFY